jgi:hypothetical protein
MTQCSDMVGSEDGDRSPLKNLKTPKRRYPTMSLLGTTITHELNLHPRINVKSRSHLPFLDIWQI